MMIFVRFSVRKPGSFHPERIADPVIPLKEVDRRSPGSLIIGGSRKRREARSESSPRLVFPDRFDLGAAPLTSIVGVGDGSPDRASGGADDLFSCAAEIIARSASFPEKCGCALCRIPPFTPFPAAHAGSCLVDRAMPSTPHPQAFAP
jgi:hypothetical protein